MTPERWTRLKEIFEAAFEKTGAERASFLEFSCAGDACLRAEVEQMLLASVEPSLASPVAALHGRELAPGDLVSHYRVEAKLGEGGMGVVYRATDTRLRRSVALKFVNGSFGAGGQREARAIAALNHPNICTLHDVGPDFLVMELVEGPTLAERASKGAIPIKEALDIARQIATALETAHDKGIVHRDLKPGNIKLTLDDQIKVLDFGLAKTEWLGTEDCQEHSPTLTSTLPGTILGTAAYMSPEQALGKPVDKRTDIWSFGVVLWEMLTGRRLFGGEAASDTIAAVLRAPIEVEALPGETPPSVRALLRRCLDREPKTRLRDIGEARFVLENPSSVEPPPTSKTSLGNWIPAVACLMVALIGLAAALYSMRRPEWDLAAYKFTPVATEAEPESLGVWSPDGKSIAYLKNVAGGLQVMLRNLSAPSPTMLTRFPGGVFRAAPFFSRDGEQVYFIASRNPDGEGRAIPQSLWSIAAIGGDAREVISVSSPAQILAATLSSDGKTLAIWEVYEEAGKRYRGLFISSPPGAAPRKYEPAPFRGEAAYQPNYLRFSPDGSTIALSAAATLAGQDRLWIIPFPNKPNTRSQPIYTPYLLSASDFDWMPDSRFLCLAKEGNLYMADTHREELRQITAAAIGGADHPAVSPDGKRILFTASVSDYDITEVPLDGSPPKPLIATARTEKAGSWSAAGDQMAFITDRSGDSEIWLRSSDSRWERPIVRQSDFPEPPHREFNSVALSPDGTRVAYIRSGRLWVSSVSGGKASEVVPGGKDEFGGPSWSPDSSEVAYLVTVDGKYRLAVARVGSRQPVAVLPEVAGPCRSAPVWSPDGRWIACGGTGFTVLLMSPDGAQSRSLRCPVRPFYDRSVLVWSRDAGTLYIADSQNGKSRLDGIDVRTGTARQIAEYSSHVNFSDGFAYTLTGSLSRDGRSFATTIFNQKADLWIFQGFPQPRGRWF